jgi:hypothetical protein
MTISARTESTQVAPGLRKKRTDFCRHRPAE